MSRMALRTRALVLDHCCVSQAVEHGRGPGIGRTIFLDQVQPGEGNIEPRLLRELEHHEFKLDAVLHDLLQAQIARDAVLHMHDIVAHGEVAKIGDEGRRLRLGLDRRGARGDVGLIGKVVRAKER